MTSHSNRLPDSLAGLLKSGDRVFVAGAVNEPLGLLDQLRHLPLPADLEFIQFPIGGLNTTDFTGLSPSARLTTVFMTPALSAAAVPRLQFLPMQMRQFFDYLGSDIDLALIQVAKDVAGNLRAGPNVDFLAALLASDALIAAELNEALVAPAGCPLVPPNRLACVLRSARALPELPAVPADPVAQRIGAQVAALIQASP